MLLSVVPVPSAGQHAIHTALGESSAGIKIGVESKHVFALLIVASTQAPNLPALFDLATSLLNLVKTQEPLLASHATQAVFCLRATSTNEIWAIHLQYPVFFTKERQEVFPMRLV